MMIISVYTDMLNMSIYLSTAYKSVFAIAILMQVLCQLSGLPGAGFSHNDHHAVLSDYIK